MSVALSAPRRSVAPLLLLAAAFLCIVHGVFAASLRLDIVVAMALVFAAALVARPVLEWRSLVVGLLVVILFIPIRRYVLPGSLPFQLEPYRLYVMVLVGGWLLSVLVDPRVSARRTGFDRPFVFLVGSTVVSVLANPTRVESLAGPVLKSLTFFLSFVLVIYVLVSVLRTHADVDRMIKILVVGGAVISVSAVVESRTGFNVFDHFPVLAKSTVETELGRSGHGRAFGPAQHPIALGAALTMLVPLAVYVARKSRSRWWYVTSALLILGSFATISRTSIIMLGVVLLFSLWLYPRQTRRLWPLTIPVVIAIHFFLPGTLGTLQAYFLPSEGIVQQQTQYHAHVDMSNPQWCNIAPRLARIKPMLDVWRQSPIFGSGFGTRITDGPTANTCVLDDQWLSSLLETGVVGILAWWALIVVFVRRTMRIAKHEDSHRARLLGALGTSVGALGIGMFFFDALSFIQLTFLFFIYLAFGSIVLLRTDEEQVAAPAFLRRPVVVSPAIPRAAAPRTPAPAASPSPLRVPTIGVSCAPEERMVVREFFELFKVPWAFCGRGRSFDVVLATSGAHDAPPHARVVLAFGSVPMTIDAREGVRIARRLPAGQVIHSDGLRIPLAEPVLTFAEPSGVPAAAIRLDTPGGTLFRYGYDLFAEVERLLREGQNVGNADIATIDRHIELLRRCLLAATGVVVEIPPVREGHPYAVCLTHDIDFLELRRHRGDRTLLGFLYRAGVGSLRDVFTRRGGVRRLARNWLAVASLPLVHLGLRSDPWQPFASYVQADGTPSTFFVIPFRDRGGENLEPAQARRRRVNYDVSDISSTLGSLHREGYEVGVHGIDAWCSTSAGLAERDRVAEAVAGADLGVRMHWLCFEPASYRRLEAAGYAYDATCGFNDAVGFRAGTAQVFRPLGVERLLELPLHVQDTALFYPGRLHLSEKRAWSATEYVRQTVAASGGVLTISWHDRSLAPERLWDGFYERLLTALRSDGAWFGTAREVVDWFRVRRTLAFDGVDVVREGLRVRLAGGDARAAAAGLLIRVHIAQGETTAVLDVPWRGAAEVLVPLSVPGRTEVLAR